MNELTIQELSNSDLIRSRIFTIRGVQVMLDRDLAELYGVVTKVLNQAVKRNIERFPERYMFQLNKDDVANMRSQIVTGLCLFGIGNQVYMRMMSFVMKGCIPF